MGKSLTLTVGANESTNEDEVTDGLAVGPKTADSEVVLKTSGVTVTNTAKMENMR